MRLKRGFAYIEVVVAIVLIAVALIPALDALQSGMQASAVLAEGNSLPLHLQEKMQLLLAEPLETLDGLAAQDNPAGSTPTSPSARYSDGAGDSRRRLVYLSRFDPDTNTFTANRTGLVWVKVMIEGGGQALQTLTSAE